MGHLARLNKYLLKYKYRFILGILCVFLSKVFIAFIPRQIRLALDFTLQKADELKLSGIESVMDPTIQTHLIQYTLQILAFVVIMGVFMYYTRMTIIINSRYIEHDLRQDLYKHYQSLDQSFYRRNKTGDLMARITEDVNKVRMYLGPAILYGLNLISLFVVVIGFMLSVNVKLTLYTLLPLPFLSLSIYFISSKIHKKSEIIQTQLASLNSLSQEVFSGIAVIKSYVKENQFSKLFSEESIDFKKKSLDLARFHSLFFPLMILLTSLSTLVVVVVGGIEHAAGRVTYGNITEFILYVNLLTWPVTSIGWIASIIQEASASQKRINEFWDTPAEIDNPENARLLPELQGKFVFDNVSYTYSDSGIEAVKNLNFTILPGEKILIMGKTASGKTTIADLLLRLFDPTEGEIYVDDMPLKELDLHSYRKQIGYVTQDNFLFSDTIENNINLAVEDPDFERVGEYAGYASVANDISELPDQYQTRVGERGVTLSGGQKQRVSIARTFITDPNVVILDDALSAVDTKTETTILEYFNSALQDKTAIIITHRVFSSLEIDRVIILEDGEIVEQGRPEELLNYDSRYAEYYALHDSAV